MLKETKNGFEIQVIVSACSSKNEISNFNGAIKIKITAPAVDNKANKALLNFLCKQFNLPKTSLEIIKGQNCKHKTVLIKTLDKNIINIISEKLKAEQ